MIRFCKSGVPILVALAVSCPLYATQYSIEELPRQIINPVGINAKGMVVGNGGVYDPRDHSFTRLRCTGSNCSVKVTAINDYSVVVGSVSFDDPFTLGGEGMHGAYWQPKLSPQATVITSVRGTREFFTSVSNSNDILKQENPGILTQFFFSALKPDQHPGGWAAPFNDLIACGAAAYPDVSMTPSAVNDQHRVAGTAPWSFVDEAGICQVGTHPFISTTVSFGVIADLLAGNPGGLISFARANSINSLDDVVGEAVAPVTSGQGGGFKAALYRGGGITFLGTLQNIPGLQSSAVAINDYSEIVGWSDFNSPEEGIVPRAFVSTGSGMSDLNTLINPRNRLAGRVILTQARAINCQGWIVANGYEKETLIPHAYLLKPQPQPQRPECLQKMAYPDRAPIIPDIWS